MWFGVPLPKQVNNPQLSVANSFWAGNKSIESVGHYVADCSRNEDNVFKMLLLFLFQIGLTTEQVRLLFSYSMHQLFTRMPFEEKDDLLTGPYYWSMFEGEGDATLSSGIA